jgi:hypothetical protein
VILETSTRWSRSIEAWCTSIRHGGVFGGRHRGSIDVDARRTPASLTIASTLERWTPTG